MNPPEELPDPPRTYVPPLKPIIIMVCPAGLQFRIRYRSLLLKLQRDVHILYALNLMQLDMFIEHYHVDDLAGFIVTDADIMNPEHEALSLRLATLTEIADCEWSLLFAFDFPGQVTRHPVQFGRYMEEFFGLDWRISGRTTGKIKLGLRRQALRKMGNRPYRPEYLVRGVFLRGVKQADKLLVAVGGFGPGGQPDSEQGVQLLITRPDGETMEMEVAMETETESTIEEEDEECDSVDEEEGSSTRGRQGMRGGRHEHALSAVDEGDKEDLNQTEHDWADDELSDSEDTNEGERLDSHRDTDENSSRSESVYSSRIRASSQQHPVRRRRRRRGVRSQDDVEQQQQETDSDWVPSDDEGTNMNKFEADCPVAIHEVKTWVSDEESDEEELMVRGYIGFVGHYEDNRSMASLMLGMCAVRAWEPS